MYTANDARASDENDLDDRIERAVKSRSAGPYAAYLRVYAEDPWRNTIREDLEKRGFHSVYVPDFILSGDVYFSWEK